MIDLIFNFPVEADFNAQDTDGAIRLYQPLRSALDLKEIFFTPLAGKHIWLTDGDVEVVAQLELRNEAWVALPVSQFKNVDAEQAYYVENVSKNKDNEN